jgi:uncharacterized protein (TIRG00374 family)
MINAKQKMLRSRSLRIAAGVAISGFFLFLAFHKIEFSLFLRGLRKINMLSVVICIFFFFLSCFFRAIMWRMTTRPLGKIRFSTLFGGVVVGYMANNFLPFRTGELVRSYFLTSHTKISMVSTFSTVCIERIFDVFSLGLLMIIGLAYGIRGLTFHAGKTILIALGVFSILSVSVILLMLRISGLENRYSNILSRLLDMLGRFLRPLKQLKHGKTFTIIMIFSIAAWISNYLSVLALIHDLLPFYLKTALLLLLFVNIGLLIPSSPGSLGVMQIAFWMALAPLGMAKEDSLALSFAYQGGLFLFTLLIGMPYFLKAHIQLKEVEKQRSNLLKINGTNP